MIVNSQGPLYITELRRLKPGDTFREVDEHGIVSPTIALVCDAPQSVDSNDDEDSVFCVDLDDGFVYADRPDTKVVQINVVATQQ